MGYLQKMEWFDSTATAWYINVSSTIKAVVNQVISFILFTDRMNKAGKIQV